MGSRQGAWEKQPREPDKLQKEPEGEKKEGFQKILLDIIFGIL